MEGAVTVFGKNHYRAMIYEHLKNRNTYQKLDENLGLNITKKVKNYYANTKTFSQIRSLSISMRQITTKAIFIGSLKYKSPDL